MPIYSYKIGTSGSGTAGMTNIESLTTPIPAPHSSFQPYSQAIPLGNGQIRGGGWQVAEWKWGFLTRGQRDQLRTFCTTASNVVTISTRTNESADTYANFSAIMIWPQEETKDAGRRIPFVVKFQKLTAI